MSGYRNHTPATATTSRGRSTSATASGTGPMRLSERKLPGSDADWIQVSVSPSMENG